jgi:hypothetical protein
VLHRDDAEPFARADIHRQATWPEQRPVASSVARAKWLADSVRSAQTLGVTSPPLPMLFRKPPTTLYVGALLVQPRRDFLRHLEGGLFEGASLDSALQQQLLEVFSLPRASEVQNPQDGDMAVDVVVESYSRGGSGEVSTSSLYLPVLWRPKVRIGARIYYIKTGRYKATAKVTRRMGWGEYLSSLLHWKVYFGFSSPASRRRLEQLLAKAAAELKTKVQRAL